MKLPLILFLLVLLVSCSSTNNSVSAYQQYNTYVELLKTQNYDDAIDLLTPYNQKRFKNKLTDETFEEFFPFFSSLDTVVVNLKQHFEVMEKSKSCLTVFGYDSEGEPTSLYFELLNHNGVWKFQYVQLNYLDSEEAFPAKAICPIIPK